MLDRAAIKAVLREQDLWLMSQAAQLPPAFGSLGADRLLASSLTKGKDALYFELRLFDVPSGKMVGSIVHRTRSEEEIVERCGSWVQRLMGGQDAGGLEIDASIESLWKELDDAETRKDLGRHLERAESVYRRYAKSVSSGDAAEVERLRPLAFEYLLGSLALAQRARKPPEGMVYVRPGRVVLKVPGDEPCTFEIDGFFIDRCEYTNAQYADYLNATGRPAPPHWSPPGEASAKLPVTWVDWEDASRVARWRGMSLPTQLQWLRAARGDAERLYPWGDDWSDSRCNFARGRSDLRIAQVGAYAESAAICGALDLAGNAWEWLDTWQNRAYWRSAPRRNPPGPREGAARQIAGGSFRTGRDACRSDSIMPLSEHARQDDLGFRCVLACPFAESP